MQNKEKEKRKITPKKKERKHERPAEINQSFEKNKCKETMESKESD